MSDGSGVIANGCGAAAVLAAAIAAFLLGLLALGADAFAPLARVLNFRNATGPLSGVSDVAIIAWLAVWFALSRRWSGRNVNLRRINLVAIALFAAGLLLTFPPFMDLLQGK
jgi:hypothetical protein